MSHLSHIHSQLVKDNTHTQRHLTALLLEAEILTTGMFMLQVLILVYGVAQPHWLQSYPINPLSALRAIKTTLGRLTSNYKASTSVGCYSNAAATLPVKLG